jgi:zinc D-Ala-D-Ala carboxypeptidase
MKYFSYQELFRSQVALDNDIVNMPSVWRQKEVYNNLWELVENLLDPIREKFATPMIITSGYRTEKVNDLVNGKVYSQHMKGKAVDFYFERFSKKEMAAAFFEIAENFDFDQLIYYKKKGFIHISYNAGNNRHQSFMK